MQEFAINKHIKILFVIKDIPLLKGNDSDFQKNWNCVIRSKDLNKDRLLSCEYLAVSNCSIYRLKEQNTEQQDTEQKSVLDMAGPGGSDFQSGKCGMVSAGPDLHLC